MVEGQIMARGTTGRPVKIPYFDSTVKLPDPLPHNNFFLYLRGSVI